MFNLARKLLAQDSYCGKRRESLQLLKANILALKEAWREAGRRDRGRREAGGQDTAGLPTGHEAPSDI